MANILYLLVVYAQAIVFAIGFMVGVAFIPFLAKAVGGIVPDFIAEPIANKVWMVALIAMGNVVIWQEESDEYTIHGVSREDFGPPNLWSRLMGTPIGISYARTKDALGDAGEKLDPSSLVAGDGDLPGDRTTMDNVERGGAKTFIEADEDHEAGLYVRVGEYLSDLKDADGLDAVAKAKDETIKSEGGGGGMSSVAKAIYWSSMGMMGTVLGIFMFFI